MSLEHPTPAERAQHYSAAMDTVRLLNGGKPEGMTDAAWADCRYRNKAHLEIMLAKRFWVNEDLAPIRAAMDANVGAVAPPRVNTDESASEKIAHSYAAAMDSVHLLNRQRPEGLTDVEWADTVRRNKEHLRIMLAKTHWSSAQNLQPLREALNASLRAPINVGPLQVPDSVVPPSSTAPSSTAPSSTPAQPALTDAQLAVQRAAQEERDADRAREVEEIDARNRRERAARDREHRFQEELRNRREQEERDLQNGVDHSSIFTVGGTTTTPTATPSTVPSNLGLTGSSPSPQPTNNAVDVGSTGV